jgi:anthranilate synthase component 2
MRIALIDNYDSFTYNLVHYLQVGGAEVDVFYNDRVSLDALEVYDRLVLSPGPGLPAEAGITCEAIRRFAPNKPILGVCLGHQAIGEVFGGSLYRLKNVMHGCASQISVMDRGHPLFRGLPAIVQVGHYHSWVVKNAALPHQLMVSALGGKGEVMALRHVDYPTCGVQFHPESLLTPLGQKMISQWIAS